MLLCDFIRSIFTINLTIKTTSRYANLSFHRKYASFALMVFDLEKRRECCPSLAIRFDNFAGSSKVLTTRYCATVIRIDLLTKPLQLVGEGSCTCP